MDFAKLIETNVKGARIIANPGCYTTCSIHFNCYPMVKEGLIDPKSH